MRHTLYAPLAVAMAIAMIVAACSSPEPSQRFLNSPMSVVSFEKGQEQIERLRLRPIDIYNVFDLNVKSKKWKKVHENSWTMIVDGRNPSSGLVTRMTITFAVEPKLNDNIVVTEIIEAGQSHSPAAIARILLQLNKAAPGR